MSQSKKKLKNIWFRPYLNRISLPKLRSNDVRTFLLAFTQPKLNLARREVNNATHRLPRTGIGRQYEVSWFEEPLDIIMDILLDDISC